MTGSAKCRYIGAEQKHYKGYKKEDFKRLLDVLSGIQGKFILSNFNSDILQEYCEANNWNNKVISLKSMIPALVHKPRRKYEVLVWNYTPEQGQLKFE